MEPISVLLDGYLSAGLCKCQRLQKIQLPLLPEHAKIEILKCLMAEGCPSAVIFEAGSVAPEQILYFGK